MGYESYSHQSESTNQRIDKIATKTTEEKPHFSYLASTKLSVKDLQDKLQPLKSALPMIASLDSARPMISDEILENVGEDTSRGGDYDYFNDSLQKPAESQKQTESEHVPTVNYVETEEDVFKKKIHDAVRKHIIGPNQLGDIGLLTHEAKKVENIINSLFFGGLV